MIRVVIGDLHGQVETLRSALEQFAYADEIIVAGDFGLGFHKELDRQFELLGDYILKHDLPSVSFIRGNHDNPKACKEWAHSHLEWIPDGYIEYDTLYLGGAKSHDRGHRKEGQDWWPDEELSVEEWEEIFEILKGQEGNIKRIISHDAPKCIKDYLKQTHFQHYEDTTTSDKMQILLGMLPNLKTWIHGHYHSHHNTIISGVRFLGLAAAHELPATSVHINYSMHTFFENGDT